MSFILVYVTYPNEMEADKIITHLIEKKIIACANLIPVQSHYSWKGRVQNEKEIVSILKTRKENWTKLQKEIKKMHSYEVPCIVKLSVSANKEYEKQVNKETK